MSQKEFRSDVWVEGEIQANIDGYGNTDEQAAQHVLDLLLEDEYRDELTDRQVIAAAAYLRRRAKQSKTPARCTDYRAQMRGMDLKSVACANCGELPSNHGPSEEA